MEEVHSETPDVLLEDLTVFNTSAPRKKTVWREWVESLALTAVFVWIFTSYIAQATQVPTESMKPTILVGDHFFLDKVAFPANYPKSIAPYLPDRSIERGEVVAFRSPTGGSIPFVKRVIGIPGDTVEIRDKVVHVNSGRLDEPYKIHVDPTIHKKDPWTPEELQARDNYGPVTLPEQCYFVMGDNRDNSNDSRYWGFINKNDIIGKPLFIYWSFESDPYVPGEKTVGDHFRGYLSVVTHFFTRTRWFRTGTMIE